MRENALSHVIADLVRGMERAVLESVARRWCAVGLSGGWAWVNDADGTEALYIGTLIDGQESPILIVAQPEAGWYEAVHGRGETLAVGPAREVLDAVVYWVEHSASRQLPLS
jgi:hypothetical protein